jgi:hypothetical protein
VDRNALAGMTAGATIIFFFGAIWLVLGLLGGKASPGWLRVGVLLAGLALSGSIGSLGWRVSRLSQDPTPAAKIAVSHQVGQSFYWIFGIEMAAVFVAVLVLKAVHRPAYILCVIAAIVGIHFLPLARLFGAPVYCATGLLGCAIGATGLFVADPGLRQIVVGLSFGLVLWATAAWIAYQGLAFTATRPR